MTRVLASLLRCERAAAAVEMVLVMPILLILLFGSVELGNYFMAEHAVQKGVRDASRYAARLPLQLLLTDDTCVLGEDEVQDQIRRVARTGDPDDGGTPRLFMWDSNDTVVLTLDCPDVTYSEDGLYSEFPIGAANINVAATVPYQPLFDYLPFVQGAGLQLNARSQAAVFGA